MLPLEVIALDAPCSNPSMAGIDRSLDQIFSWRCDTVGKMADIVRSKIQERIEQ